MEKQTHSAEAFRDFASNIPVKIPSRRQAYNEYTRTMSPVRTEFTKQQILNILRGGDPQCIRELSRYYSRFSGLYNRFLLYMATVIGYDTVVIPKYDINNPPNKATLTKQFAKACEYVDSLEVKKTFSEFTYEIERSGIFYGILREQEGKHTVQPLPPDCCRTRFRDMNGLDILEFNLNFFNRIYNEKVRDEVARGYPDIVYRAYKKYFNGKSKSNTFWVEIPVTDGGIVFYFNNETFPPFAAAIPAILEFDDAKDREAERDENELIKLLIQRLPIDSKTGELVFELPEAQEIHQGTVNMLKNQDTIDVVTTFADAKLESVQDSSAASQSSDRLQKYKTVTFDSLGSSELLFNSTGNASIAHSIHKDIALALNWSEHYRVWLKTLLNLRFGTSKLKFDVEILPVNENFRKDMTSMYLNAAQYGYSKFYAGVALGVKQSNLLSLTDFENNVLGLTSVMLPLQSSYTGGGDKNNTEKEKTGSSSPASGIIDEDNNGRPKSAEESLSDKTISNQNGAT